MEQRQAREARLDEGGHGRREDEGVPEGAAVLQPARELRGRLLVERADAMDRAAGHPAHRLPGLDPAVVGLRLGRVHAQQQEPLGVLPHVRARGGDVGHEDRLLHDEVVGREHDDHGPGIPGPDPVRGQQHARRGAAVAGLGQHRDRRVPGELGRDVSRVARLGHRDGLRRRDQPRHPIERGAQQGLRAGERAVLLRPRLPVQLAGQGLQPDAFSAGEHDRPEIASRIEHGLDLPREAATAAASRLMGSVR